MYEKRTNCGRGKSINWSNITDWTAPVREIARKLGCKDKAVYMHIKRYGRSSEQKKGSNKSYLSKFKQRIKTFSRLELEEAYYLITDEKNRRLFND